MLLINKMNGMGAVWGRETLSWLPLCKVSLRLCLSSLKLAKVIR